MRKSVLTQIVISGLLFVLAAGCRSTAIIGHPAPGRTVGKGMPPGQAKKVYGHQSAKAFAPGQQKKNSGVINTQGNGKKYKKDKKSK
jgi:hypothetical protein